MEISMSSRECVDSTLIKKFMSFGIVIMLCLRNDMLSKFCLSEWSKKLTSSAHRITPGFLKPATARASRNNMYQPDCMDLLVARISVPSLFFDTIPSDGELQD